MIQIVKRDGTVCGFKPEKIEVAIEKAVMDVDGDLSSTMIQMAKEIADEIFADAKEASAPFTVEQIQDMVENKLKEKRLDVYGAYSSYRQQHEALRKQKTAMEKAVQEKLEATNIENQNANVDEKSFSGRMGEARNVVTKQYALDHVMSKKARRNHLENRIYEHDLDSYAIGESNCCSIPFDDALKNGVTLPQTSIRGARSVNTAFQLVAVIFQLQSQQQFGGVSATHLDWTMVPYVRISFWKHYRDGMKFLAGMEMPAELTEDLSITDLKYQANEAVYKYAMEMTERETYQAVEGMYHNLNSLQSRSGGQLN